MTKSRLPLHALAEIRTGSAPRAGGGGAVYLQARSIHEGLLLFDRALAGSPPERAADRARVLVGDVLVNTRGALNTAVAATALPVETYASLDLLLIRPDASRVRADYLAVFLNLASTQGKLASCRTGGSLPRLGLDELANLMIPLPDMKAQAAIAALTADARREAELLKHLMERRQRLLDEILRRAAEGEPMPGANPAWASERFDRSSDAVEAFSTLANGVASMTKSAGGSKGGGTRHVVPAPGGGWNNRKGGASRASSHHDTKQEAVDAARQQSRNESSELKIHNRDGRIAQSDSHGRDPNPPKG